MARLPRDWTDVFTDETAADAAPVRAALGAPHRALQAALVLGRPQDVADRLVAWVLPVRRRRRRPDPVVVCGVRDLRTAPSGGGGQRGGLTLRCDGALTKHHRACTASPIQDSTDDPLCLSSTHRHHHPVQHFSAGGHLV